MASPPSSPSDSSGLSLLGFSYDRDVDEVAYPLDHDQSQPQTPASTSTVGPISHESQRSLGPSWLSAQSKRPAEGRGEEYELGSETGKGERSSEDIDLFSQGELILMSGSSLLVLALICVSVMLTFGKIVL